MSLFSTQPSGLDALLHRSRPSAWQRFWRQPCVFLAQKLYTWHSLIPRRPITDPVSVVCISDTHNSQPDLPNGDILIHAGDLTQSGSLKEIQAAVDWLQSQPHPTKIVVAGNHDTCLDHKYSRSSPSEEGTVQWGDILYLHNTETTVTCSNGRRLRVYGSPFSPRHGNWAFQYPRSEDVWAEIPEDIDILITHGPPRAHLDLLDFGCVHLLQHLWRVRPLLHVFGHVHEGAGTEWVHFSPLQQAFERTVISRGGLWDLVLAVKEFIWSLSNPLTESKCLLVNAAMVGGLRDDERRRPVEVII